MSLQYSFSKVNRRTENTHEWRQKSTQKLLRNPLAASAAAVEWVPNSFKGWVGAIKAPREREGICTAITINLSMGLARSLTHHYSLSDTLYPLPFFSQSRIARESSNSLKDFLVNTFPTVSSEKNIFEIFTILIVDGSLNKLAQIIALIQRKSACTWGKIHLVMSSIVFSMSTFEYTSSFHRHLEVLSWQHVRWSFLQNACTNTSCTLEQSRICCYWKQSGV